MLEVKLSQREGRGIFAQSDFLAGDFLCISYSWELSPDDIKLIDRTSIEGFWFDHPVKTGWALLPLGLAALVNCSLKPNAILKWEASEIGCIGSLYAAEDIRRGEEVLIDYGIGLEPGWIP